MSLRQTLLPSPEIPAGPSTQCEFPLPSRQLPDEPYVCWRSAAAASLLFADIDISRREELAPVLLPQLWQPACTIAFVNHGADTQKYVSNLCIAYDFDYSIPQIKRDLALIVEIGGQAMSNARLDDTEAPFGCAREAN